MVSFENTEIAFKSKSNNDLKRAYLLFKILGNHSLVKFGNRVTKLALKLRLPIKGMIKRTIFKQFCGGETILETLPTADRLAKHHVKVILDYSVEGKTTDEDFDITVHEIKETILEGKNNPNIPFAVFKMTGICLFRILEKANDSIDHLTEEELVQYQRLIERVDEICKLGHDNDVPVFIDAEESWIQGTIDRIAAQMMLRYNRKKAAVYNTLQLYRHDRLAFLGTCIEHARQNKYFLGVKIVRGAYMEKERNRAEEQGYPSPIQPDKQSSDRDFNAALQLAMENLDITSICAGSHNEESALLLTKLMRGMDISNDDQRVYFSQLLGMSDHISFNLADKGYRVAKYVPYGPIHEVIPYLMRRANENTSVAGQTGRELSLIIKERKRRRKA